SYHSFILTLFLSTLYFLFFFFNATAPTDIYTLSLHDALPILLSLRVASLAGLHLRTGDNAFSWCCLPLPAHPGRADFARDLERRSEEHTSELQSLRHLVCRLLLEKKKRKKIQNIVNIHIQAV